MPDLVEQVTAALGNPGDSPWLPGLATGLAERGWADLYRDTGLTPSEYGTARVMARDRNAPRQIVSVVPAGLDEGDFAQIFQIELLGRDAAWRYEESGVKFYSEDEINQKRMTERIGEALTVLKGVPTLFKTVAELVRSVHLIDAGDDDYDVSFSEPHIPFSVFVSVPQTRSVSSTLRIAEAIVHEAMHLQLTLIEQISPLIKHISQQYYSPWRGDFRNAQGVLHGLYVFRVIEEFLRELQTQNPSECNLARYARNRLSEINNQVNRIRSFQESEDLNDIGAKFARQLIAGFNSN